MLQFFRPALAFALAPLLGVLAAACVLAVATFHTMDFWFALSMAPFAYCSALTAGLAAFLMSRSYLPVPLWTYSVAGLIAASCIAIPISAFLGAYIFGLVGLVGGLAGGLAFGLILGTKSNQRLERPVTPKSDAP